MHKFRTNAFDLVLGGETTYPELCSLISIAFDGVIIGSQEVFLPY